MDQTSCHQQTTSPKTPSHGPPGAPHTSTGKPGWGDGACGSCHPNISGDVGSSPSSGTFIRTSLLLPDGHETPSQALPGDDVDSGKGRKEAELRDKDSWGDRSGWVADADGLKGMRCLALTLPQGSEFVAS